MEKVAFKMVIERGKLSGQCKLETYFLWGEVK